MKTLFTQNKAIAIFDATTADKKNSFVRCHLYTIGSSLQYERSFLIKDCFIKANQINSFTCTEHEIILRSEEENSIFKIKYFLKTGKVDFLNHKTTPTTPQRQVWLQNAFEKMQNFFKQPHEASFS